MYSFAHFTTENVTLGLLLENTGVEFLMKNLFFLPSSKVKVQSCLAAFKKENRLFSETYHIFNWCFTVSFISSSLCFRVHFFQLAETIQSLL